MRNLLFTALAVLTACLATSQVEAQTTLGTFNEWSAFTRTDDGSKVCYMGANPQKSQGDYSRRGDVYILVTHRPAEKTVGVISIEAGYSYKEGSEVEVAIGGKTFRLYTAGGQAWAYRNEDAAMITAMRAGSNMVVKGTSNRGTVTTDTYSLAGFTAGYQAIGKACNVR